MELNRAKVVRALDRGQRFAGTKATEARSCRELC